MRHVIPTPQTTAMNTDYICPSQTTAMNTDYICQFASFMRAPCGSKGKSDPILVNSLFYKNIF